MKTSSKTKQFKHKIPQLKIYDRKVYRTGFSRTLSISKLLPKNWVYVRCTILNKTDKVVTVQIEPLGSYLNGPSTPPVNKNRKQNA